MKIALGSDHAGYVLKEAIKSYFSKSKIEFKDFGTFKIDSCDYPEYSYKVSIAVASGEADLGVLVCGTGIGMCIAANKVAGANAALCSDAYSTERSRKSNNANIMTLGSQVVGSQLAKQLLTIWMGAEYTPGGRSEPKIQRINDYAEQNQT